LTIFIDSNRSHHSLNYLANFAEIRLVKGPKENSE